MSRTGARYKTRDPKTTMRDPEYGTRDGVLNMPDQSPPVPPRTQLIGHVPVIRQEPLRCAACGELAVWRPGGTTVPNVSTQEMFRWRSCAHCKQTQYIARPMTDGERVKFLAPDRV